MRTKGSHSIVKCFCGKILAVVGGVVLLITPPAHADKIETIQKAMHEHCHQKVSSKRALTLIRPLYLTCVPGTRVQIGNCDLKCLKNNAGAVLGQE